MNIPSPPKPPWFARKIACGGSSSLVRSVLSELSLRTVCDEAHCPNRGECHAAGTATFLILGGRCTRNCRFCAIAHGIPSSPDPDEPSQIAEAIHALGLGHAVITSVTRDDLPDGGASQFAATINAIHTEIPGTDVEVLIPDFAGSEEAIALVAAENPDVIAHNIETVPRLYGSIRPDAVYERSLWLIECGRAKAQDSIIKSGLMLGLGETHDEIIAVFMDLRDAGCDILTIGQYLQPDQRCVPVDRFISPQEFSEYRDVALSMGFTYVAAGPFVRSSYHAEQALSAVRCISLHSDDTRSFQRSIGMHR